MMITAIVTTNLALLRVEINLEAANHTTTVLNKDKDAYFGLTKGLERTILVAARNHYDIDQIEVFELDQTTDTLTSSVGTDCGIVALRPIRRIGEFLCVVQNIGSSILVFHLPTGKRTRTIDLLPFVPRHLQHEANLRWSNDPYHFNSLSFASSSLLVLANNWHYGSFALELAWEIDEHGPLVSELRAVHEGLGQSSHDIVRVGDTLYVLDSGGAQLIVREANATTMIPLPPQTYATFPRGLAVTNEHLLIGYGSQALVRWARSSGPTRLCVLDRGSLAVVMDIEVGLFGDTKEVLVVSEVDHSDLGVVGTPCDV